MMYKIIHGTPPKYMMDVFTEQVGPQMYSLRNSDYNVEIAAARTSSLLKFNFVLTGANI